MPKWLKDAVFYEIYPQSFYDTNGDGIGDFNGIIEKLDYIKDLGCNALWINPCYDSPFSDAGYDVRDYKKVAPRYGTNSDLYRLFGEAHKRGIHVLLDLVPGHTSEEHVWFKESQKAEKNEYSNRYIWTNAAFQPAKGFLYIGGETERDGVYVLNFFKSQPALNYGFLNPDPKEEWQLPMDYPDCLATREAIKDVMRFWLDHGCDGFRVDMADSLVKNDDENKSGTCAVWSDVRSMLDEEYPDAAMVSEWNAPGQALNRGGFHMDFYLNWGGNGYNSLFRDYETGEDNSFFKKDAKSDIMRFLDEYIPRYEATRENGYYCLITGNHDTRRLKNSLDDSELKIAYTFLFTMPGIPFIYYGDEIGMRYLDVPTKEGGYFRTGSRTPMQWSQEKNDGFSTCPADALYLPVDPSSDAPNVAAQEADENSLLNTVKSLLSLRHQEEELQADAEFEVVYAVAGKLPFVYRRGTILVALNPSGQSVSAPVEAEDKEILFSIGSADVEEGRIVLGPQSCMVLK